MKIQFFNNPDFLTVTGSRLYGTYRTDGDNIISDSDKRGFVIPPYEYLLSVKNFEQANLPNEEDTVIYSLHKFISMLLKGNMQILELLFAPRDKHLICNKNAEKIIQNRHLFVAKHYYKSIIGFSYSEWRKANGTRIEIEKKSKTQQDVITDILNVFDHLSKETKDQIIELLYSGHEKRIVPHVHSMGEKRKKEIIDYGYCVSSACHAIRLLYECHELMETGQLTFPVHNSDLLRMIKQGKIPLSEATKIYDDAMRKADDAYNNSQIQDRPREADIWGIYLEIINKILDNHGSVR